ncbi:MAG: hypothetical protein WBD97_26950, partial [Pseudolabrys sp.]
LNRDNHYSGLTGGVPHEETCRGDLLSNAGFWPFRLHRQSPGWQGQSPGRSDEGVNSSTQTVSRGQNWLISLTELAGVMSGCYPENRSTPKWGI